MISRKDFLAVSALAFVVLATAHGWFNGNLPLTDDLEHLHVTDVGHILEAFLEHGRLTRWDHHNVTPFGIFHPLSLASLAALPLSLVLGPIWGVKLTLIAFLLLGGLGLYFYARQWDLGPVAAFSAGTFYCLFRWNIIENVSAGHMDMTAVLALFPWTALALESSLRTGSLRKAGWAGLGLAGMATADFQLAAIGGLLIALYLPLRLFGMPGFQPPTSRKLSPLLCAVGVTALLGSCYIAATIWVNKPHLNFQGHGRYWLDVFSVSFSHILTGWAQAWDGRYSMKPHLLYIWPWVAALAAYGLRAPKAVLALGGLWTIVSALLAMGTHGPLSFLFFHAPLFENFRAPLRFYFGVSIGLALLLGACVEALGQKIRIKWAGPLAALVILLLTLGIGNGPTAFSQFKTQETSQRFKMLREASADLQSSGAFGYYPMIPAGMDREARLATLFHGRRDWTGPSPFQVNRGAVQALWAVNESFNPDEVARHLDMLNHALILPRSPEAKEWLTQSDLFLESTQSESTQTKSTQNIGGVPSLTLAHRTPFFSVSSNVFGTQGWKGTGPLPLLSADKHWGHNSGLGVSFGSLGEASRYPLKFLLVKSLSEKFRNSRNQNNRPILWPDSIRPVVGPTMSNSAELETMNPSGYRFKVAGSAGAASLHILLPQPLDPSTEYLELDLRASANLAARIDLYFADSRIVSTKAGSLPSSRTRMAIKLPPLMVNLVAVRILCQPRTGSGSTLEIHNVSAVALNGGKRKTWALRDPRLVLPPPPLESSKSEARVEILDFQPRLGSYKIRIADAASTDWLFLSEPWYPGWTAQAGKTTIPIYPAWDFLLAIPLEKVRGQVLTIQYGLTILEKIGLGLSLLTVLGLIGSAFWGRGASELQ